jgi:AhpD family alkylhydroperoxidase
VYPFSLAFVYVDRKENHTMRLDAKVLSLIAVGASAGADCGPCLQTNRLRALENGAAESEIQEAIVVGRTVRLGAARKKAQGQMASPAPAEASDPSTPCCGTAESKA